jgi:hypothetical protein
MPPARTSEAPTALSAIFGLVTALRFSCLVPTLFFGRLTAA